MFIKTAKVIGLIFSTNYYTDKNGKTIKVIKISSSGKGNIIVDASTLSSGAYQYSLIVDGRLIDTKQMIRAK